MGMVLGKVTVETPNHIVVHKTDNYQIWRYPSSIAATVHAKNLNLSPTSTETDFTSAAFRSLARYIGVFGTPQNKISNSHDSETSKSEQIAMTAPVELGSQKIGMTAPVEIGSQKIGMTAPVEIGSQKIGMTAPVEMQSGLSDSFVSDMKMSFFLPSKYTDIDQVPKPTNPAVELVKIPERYHAVVQFSGNLYMDTSRGYAETLLRQLDDDSVKVVGEWSYCGYNPPITLPWLKRNEVHVPIHVPQFDSVTDNVE